MRRPLDPEDRALWARVIADVRPMGGPAADPPPPRPACPPAPPSPPLSRRPLRGVTGPVDSWDRVTAGVRPIDDRVVHPVPSRPARPLPAPPGPSTPAPIPAAPIRGVPRRDDTLDGGWDRRLARGLVTPDMTLDLHDHSLAAAHDALDQGLARAVAREARLVLLVTGRAPRVRALPGQSVRGVIRAAVRDWLAMSRFAARIAAVRPAHVRHGGAGALYVVMRRVRG